MNIYELYGRLAEEKQSLLEEYEKLLRIAEQLANGDITGNRFMITNSLTHSWQVLTEEQASALDPTAKFDAVAASMLAGLSIEKMNRLVELHDLYSAEQDNSERAEIAMVAAEVLLGIPLLPPSETIPAVVPSDHDDSAVATDPPTG